MSAITTAFLAGDIQRTYPHGPKGRSHLTMTDVVTINSDTDMTIAHTFPTLTKPFLLLGYSALFTPIATLPTLADFGGVLKLSNPTDGRTLSCSVTAPFVAVATDEIAISFKDPFPNSLIFPATDRLFLACGIVDANVSPTADAVITIELLETK